MLDHKAMLNFKWHLVTVTSEISYLFYFLIYSVLDNIKDALFPHRRTVTENNPVFSVCIMDRMLKTEDMKEQIDLKAEGSSCQLLSLLNSIHS